MPRIAACTRMRRLRADAVALWASVVWVAALAPPAAGQSSELEIGEQPAHTTLVYPPFAHTLGIHRARPSHLELFLGDRTRFDDPQGLAAVKFASDDDPEARGDDFQLTLFGVNSGRGEVLYNSSMQTLAIYGRTGGGRDELDRPHGIAATVDGRVYVADTGNRRVVRLRWDPTARSLSWSGSWSVPGPFDVAADTRGDVWVSDREADAVLRFADSTAGAGPGSCRRRWRRATGGRSPTTSTRRSGWRSWTRSIRGSSPTRPACTSSTGTAGGCAPTTPAGG